MRSCATWMRILLGCCRCYLSSWTFGKSPFKPLSSFAETSTNLTPQVHGQISRLRLLCSAFVSVFVSMRAWCGWGCWRQVSEVGTHPFADGRGFLAKS